MTSAFRTQLERCIEDLKGGTLTEQSLRQVIDTFDVTPAPHQDLLYLQAEGTSVTSSVHGIAIVANGRASDGPADPNDWPYQTVLDAIRDGWRVIQFPNLAMLLDDSRSRGLGCEFILERWS